MIANCNLESAILYSGASSAFEGLLRYQSWNYNKFEDEKNTKNPEIKIRKLKMAKFSDIKVL